MGLDDPGGTDRRRVPRTGESRRAPRNVRISLLRGPPVLTAHAYRMPTIDQCGDYS